MKVSGEHIFNGPRERVWDLVRDPEVLASALPGTQSMKQVSETEYEGKMNVRVGPVAGVFAGRLVVSKEIPPESFELSVQGRGAPGFAKGMGTVHLTDLGDNTTLMTYEGDLQVGGKIAGVGQRLMDSVSKSIIRQGLESMNNVLQARTPPVPRGEQGILQEETPQVHPEAPRPLQSSEAQFAATVAKDILQDLTADLFTPETRAIWVTGIVAILAMIVGFCLGRQRPK